MLPQPALDRYATARKTKTISNRETREKLPQRCRETASAEKPGVDPLLTFKLDSRTFAMSKKETFPSNWSMSSTGNQLPFRPALPGGQGQGVAQTKPGASWGVSIRIPSLAYTLSTIGIGWFRFGV
jgi:hypothetical protein